MSSIQATTQTTLGRVISTHQYGLYTKLSSLAWSLIFVAAPAWAIGRWIHEGKLVSLTWVLITLFPAAVGVFGLWAVVSTLREWRQELDVHERGLTVRNGTSSRSYEWNQVRMGILQRSRRSGRIHLPLSFSDGASLRIDSELKQFDGLVQALRSALGPSTPTERW